MTVIGLDLAQMRYDGAAIGANAAVAGLATLFGAPFVPALAARIGARTALFAALAVACACLALFAAVRDYWLWLGLRAVFSLALTILFVVSEYWINAVTPPARRGLVLGVYGMSLAAGFAAGPALLAATGLDGGSAFVLALGLFAAAAGPIALGGTLPTLQAQGGRRFRVADLHAAHLPLFAALLHGALETAGLGLLAVFALRAGASSATGALLVSLFAAGNVAFQVPIGLLSDRLERRRLLLAVSLLGWCGAIVLSMVPVGLVAFPLVLFVWGGLVGSFYPIGLAQIGAGFTGPDLARMNAAFIMCYALGMLVGPAFMGLALDLLPPSGFFYAAALLIAAFSIAAIKSPSPRIRPATQAL